MFSKWANERIHRMNWVDIGLLKVCVFTFALTIVQFVPQLLTIQWYWYGLIFIVTYLYLIIKIYGLKN